jgi:hypothetical protein
VPPVEHIPYADYGPLMSAVFRVLGYAPIRYA